MSGRAKDQVEAAEVVLPCPEFARTLDFFVERLGFVVRSIFPADDPAEAVVEGHGLRIRLQRDTSGDAGVLRLLCRDPAAFAAGETYLIAPNGTRIELVDADPPVVVPPVAPSFSLVRMRDATWQEGRAGMRYRDLIPGRQGGRFIASHIQIPGGGPVPDYVHFHRVRFQMIFCYKGWVRVAYEDQGPPLTMQAGDCVLQPPKIRHRVLESSAGCEVIEIGCPAEHQTFADPGLPLPTTTLRPDRDFSGQRFVHHQAASASWPPSRLDGLECRDIGIATATDGLAGAVVLRPSGTGRPSPSRHEGEFLFMFVLDGTLALQVEGRESEILGSGDAFVIPAGPAYTLSDCSDATELLEVTLPAAS